ncbi:transmembrane protein 190 [Mauremys reevesii]|uniref:transmembrane protein 190 n=1 Tax=Mauremys reevesii TaxID=260615 RepID=UPI00193F8447|nr:transmembrane protein 190 [Mauremys reevesii]
MKTGSDPRPPLPLLCLLLALSVGGAGATGIGSFFRPLTCAQHLSLRRPCGGNPESFYASQCLQRKCCHDNGTCYHRAIDAPRQRRNAGILGGVCVGAAGLFLCICVACRLKGTRAAGKEPGEPKSRPDAEVADYLMKLLEESDQEEEKGMEPREEEPKERGE